MTRGYPDWQRGVVVTPTVKSFHWSYTGSGSFTTSSNAEVFRIVETIRSGLGGKTVRFFSFDWSGYIVFTRATSNVHSYLGGIFARVNIFDSAGNVIGGIHRLQTPVVISNVDKFEVEIIIPAARIADATNPAYYLYYFGFQLAYEIL